MSFKNFKVQKAYVLFALVLYSASCQRSETDPTLAYFGESVVTLTPRDSICLDEYDIRMPSHIAVYQDVAYIKKHDGQYFMSAIDLNDGTCREILRKGRGPGEVTETMSVHFRDNYLYGYQVARGLWTRFNLQDIEGARPAIDTLCSFSSNETDDYLAYPSGVFPHKQGRIYLNSGSNWYSFATEKGKESGVGYFDFESTRECTPSELKSFYMNSVLALSPSQDKIVCAPYDGSALSFATIGEDGIMRERRQLIFIEPKVEPLRTEAFPVVLQKGVRGFVAIDANDQYVYALYSGHPQNDPLYPSYEGNHLLIFDWDGNPVRRIDLTESVLSISVVGNVLYGVSLYPDSRLYTYILNDYPQ